MSVLRSGGPGAKTITFACIHFTVAFSIAYLLTGNVGIATRSRWWSQWRTPSRSTCTSGSGSVSAGAAR